MSAPKATGYVRTIQRATGPVYYAHIRTADGRRLQPKLGPAWLKRSRPPKGHLTPAQAEAKLAAMLAGENPAVVVAPTSGANFRHAAIEWLRYVEHDRKREHSTVQGYRRAVEHRLIPKFGHLPLEAVTGEHADRWREELLAEGLSANTINKLRWKGEAIYKRAARVWKITTNPFVNVERQPQRVPTTSTCSSPPRPCCSPRTPPTTRTPPSTSSPPSPGCDSASCARCAGRDLNFTDRLVHVRRAYTRGRFKPYPKGRRRRSVPMIDQVIPALDRLSQREHFTDPDDLVFVNTTGDVVEESALRRRMWTALDAAELKRVRHPRPAPLLLHDGRPRLPARRGQGVRRPRRHRDDHALRAPHPGARRRRPTVRRGRCGCAPAIGGRRAPNCRECTATQRTSATRKARCRAKRAGNSPNHNPRVGGSSPSSGIANVRPNPRCRANTRGRALTVADWRNTSTPNSMSLNNDVARPSSTRTRSAAAGLVVWLGLVTGRSSRPCPCR